MCQTAAGSSAAGVAATPQQSKRTVEGGVVVEDVKAGHGPEAKPGKLVNLIIFPLAYAVFRTKKLGLRSVLDFSCRDKF